MTAQDIGLAEVLQMQRARKTQPVPRDAEPRAVAIPSKSPGHSLAAAWLLSLAGRALLRFGFPGPAQRLANAALASAPASPAANILAAKFLERSGDGRGALACLRTAAARDGSAKAAQWALARFLLRRGRDGIVAEAAAAPDLELVDMLTEASRSREGAIRRPALIALSNARYERGEYREALAAADAAIAEAPDDVRAMRARANALLPHNRVAEAHALFERMLAKDPANGEIARKVQLLGSLATDLARPRTAPNADSGEERPLLIGVGAGIGDLLHATPMIRNAARRSGRPVDVVVLADHPGAEFLVDNPALVRRVSTLNAEVLGTRYRTVFLAHSFGPLRFAFNAGRVGTASSWRRFRPGALHETLFNLEAAKQLIGLSYDAADTLGYFVNTLRYQPPAAALVGIHAGSKSGRWLSKRWPHFAALAARLEQQGFAVASFGTPDEYVEGTQNRTGGTIEEMCRAMLDCSHFVSNDSGPLHIASALGIPTLALFAPTDAIGRLPLAATTHALALEKDCAPCEVKDHAYFSSGRCHCIAEISVEEVETRLLDLLRDNGYEASSVSAESAVR